MSASTELIARLRLGASISRERKLNQGYDAVADEAADAIEALEKECDDLRSQVDSLNVGFNNCQKERDAFRDERNRLNQLWGDAQAQLAAAQTEVERLKAEKAVWVRRADKTWHEKHFTDQIEALQTQLAAAQGQEPACPVCQARAAIKLATTKTKECGMCGYVGTEADAVGQCPRCHWDELQLQKPAQQAQPERAPLSDKFLQPNDYHLLHRFIETTEDDEGYGITKAEIKRLADLGVVQSHGFGKYSVTMFGYWVHERYWEQNPSLPLKTNSDRNAEAAHLIKQGGQHD